MSKAKTKKSSKKQEQNAVEKEAVKVDKFNRRIPSQGHTINQQMSKTPKSIEELAKECKLPKGRIATHVRDLCNKGYFKKDKDGKYSIK